MYMTAGEIVPALTGVAWHDYVRSHFFLPLHMTTTNTSITEFSKASDAASPHAEIDGKVQPIAWYNAASIDPAGAVNSSVREMSQWMRMLLADGSYEGKQILSPAVIQEMETPQMLIGGKDGEAQFLASLNPDSHFYAYGLGFFMQDYAGNKVVWHSGHIDGMSAGLGMVPSEHLGVVVFSNMDQSWLPMALVWRVIDAYSGRPQKDWSGAILKVASASAAEDKAAEIAQEKAFQAGPAPLPLSDYVGTYSNELYGKIDIRLEHDKLGLHVSKRFVGELKHWDYDTFQVRWDYAYLGKEYATFGTDARGRPVSLMLPGFATYQRLPADGQ
jgi:CubicO group peptidase (beta-lactamase class C family)